MIQAFGGWYGINAYVEHQRIQRAIAVRAEARAIVMPLFQAHIESQAQAFMRHLDPTLRIFLHWS
jgi:hypothetical protein